MTNAAYIDPISQITKFIFIGTGPYTATLLDHNERGIQAVLDLRKTAKTVFPPSIQFKHVPLKDKGTPTPEQVAECFAFIDEAVNQGKRILVHCASGKNRSPAIVAGYIALHAPNYTLDAAVKFVKEKRRGASGNLTRPVLAGVRQYLEADHNQLSFNNFEQGISMNREHRLSKDKPYPSVGDVNFPKVVQKAAIDEPEPEVTIAPAEQANLRDVSVMPNAALTTVEQEPCLTLDKPAETSTAIIPIEREDITLGEPAGVQLTEQSYLVKIDRARQMLAECHTLPEVKKIRDIAEAARTYAKAAHLGRESQNYAAEISLEASRRAGKILSQLERKPGERTDKPAASVAGGSEYARALQDTSTPERTAQHWQTLADIPEETFDDYIQQSKDLKTEITQAGLLKAAKKAANRKCPTPIVPPEKPQVSAADLTARLTVFLAELSELNVFTKRLKYADLDEPSKTEVQTLITQLRKISKDAAERAERLQAVAS